MKVFETYPEADCILYDDKKCDGDEGIKAMKNGEVAVNFDIILRRIICYK